MGIFKRTPFEIDTTISNGSKFLNQTQFTGIVQNNNSFDVDQNAFTDALNVYVNDQNTLVSREPLVNDNIEIDYPSETAKLIDIKEANNVKVFVFKDGETYTIIAKRIGTTEKVSINSTNYHLTIFNQYIICFRVEGAVILNTKQNLAWSDFSTKTASTVTKLTIGSDIETFEPNQFTDGYIERYVRTADLSTVLPIDEKAKTTFTVKTHKTTINNRNISEPWKYTDERLFKPVYEIKEDKLSILNSISAVNETVAIPLKDSFLLSYDAGLNFIQIPYPYIGTFDIYQAKLSDDGENFFYVSDRVYRCDLATLNWETYSLYNTDGSEHKIEQPLGCSYLNKENFIIVENKYIAVKSVNLNNGLGYNVLSKIDIDAVTTVKSIYMNVDSTNTDCGIIIYANKKYWLLGITGTSTSALVYYRIPIDLNGLSSTDIDNQIDIDNLSKAVVSKSIWTVSENAATYSTRYMWTDGYDLYYDYSNSDHYKWNRNTRSWEVNSWQSSNGSTINIEGNDIWYANGEVYYGSEYKLNRNTMTWIADSKTSYTPNAIFEYGDYAYYSNSTTHKIFRSGSWDNMNWNTSEKLYSEDFWTDGINLYYSNGTTHYQLVPDSKSNSGKVKTITWNGLSSFIGRHVWMANGEIFYANGTTTYMLDVLSKTWTVVATHSSSILGQYVISVDNESWFAENSSSVYASLIIFNNLLLTNTFKVRHVADRSHGFKYKEITYEIKDGQITTSDSVLFTSTTNYTGSITKMFSGNYIYHSNITTDYSLGVVYRAYELYEIPGLQDKYFASYKYLPGSNGLYITVIDGDNVLLYSNILTQEDRIEIDYTYGRTTGFYTQVPNQSYAGSELFLTFNNELRITKNDKDGSDILFNLPKINNQSFTNDIKTIINISTTELAIFFENGITICSKVENDLTGYRYDYAKTRLTLGTKFGDSVINTADGASTLYATPRGLAIMNYQAYMATTDQTLQFISDKIYDIWNKFYLSSENITLVQHGDYVFIYNTTNKYLMLDLRNASWWKFEIPYNIKKILTDQVDLRVIADKLYKFKKIDNGTDKIEDDYIDNRYRDPGDETINWRFMSQRLHFGLPNHYKNMKQIVFHMVQSTTHDTTVNAQVKLYRKTVNYKELEVIPFEFGIDEFRTYVKRFNYWKINMLQYGIANDDKTAIPARLVLNGIGVKYEIGEEVR